jgi:peroxiredoxin Q/BCP
MIAVGDKAPDFHAQDCRGREISLAGLRGRPVVFFFFPKAFTVACTLEVRAFQDNHARIRELGAELVGVSVDSAQRQCEFAEAERVDFTLVSDESRAISKLYGVLWPVLNVDRRVTFILDEEGTVEHVIRHEVKVYLHLDDCIAYLEKRQPRTARAPASPTVQE